MQQILDYLYNLERFGIKLGLEVITKLLGQLDNPQNQFKSIHIAGTNGKGSTAAFLAQILLEAGYKVGLYTSPHLVKFNERIKVNGKDISDDELVKLTELIKGKLAGFQPTFFEFTTALAFQYFAQNNVNFAVIETGMGGRLDATNVLKPEISIITNISLDHQEHLGETKDVIALEKAAIIKENSLVVTAEKDKTILNLFKDICKDMNSSLFIANKENINIPLLGEYQVENASTAALTARLLKIEEHFIEKGIGNIKWPGRLQFLKRNLLVDSAHNIEGMKNLVNFVKDIPNKKVLVLGIAEDKDIYEMVKLIVPLFENIIITKGNYKPADCSLIKKEVEKFNKNIIIEESPIKAVKTAQSLAQKDDLILVTGSIYLIGDVLNILI